jgi:hypothetical protein
VNQETFDHIKGVGDAAAVAVTIGTIASFLPAIAALFTIIWTGLRIYESDTVQRLLGRK